MQKRGREREKEKSVKKWKSLKDIDGFHTPTYAEFYIVGVQDKAHGFLYILYSSS
jgi:hypothetical protein